MNATCGTEAIQIALTTHQHIHENIKFADQKALFLTLINTALIGYTWSQAAPTTFLFWAKLTTCAALVVGVGFAAWTVRPRGDRPINKSPGLVDPNRIVEYKDLNQYQTALNAATQDNILSQLQELIYERSTINQKKYSSLRISIIFSAIGWAAALTTAIWPTLSPLF